MTYNLNKKNKDNIPYIFPIAWIHNLETGNNSQKRRYEKTIEMFLKLRIFVKNNPNNSYEFIKEFLMKNRIFDEHYYAIDKLNNFVKFLNSKIQIDSNKSLKDTILDALNYDGNDDLTVYEREPDYSSAFNLRNISNTFYNTSSGTFQNFNFKEFLDQKQPILDEKKFNIDNFSNEGIIKHLEAEIKNLKKDAGLNFNFHDTKKKTTKSNSVLVKPFKKQSVDMKRIKVKKILKKKIKSPKKVKEKKNLRSLSVTKFDKETLDIEDIKKKNKLLEYIYLQRSKSKYFLEQEKIKHNINEAI